MSYSEQPEAIRQRSVDESVRDAHATMTDVESQLASILDEIQGYSKSGDDYSHPTTLGLRSEADRLAGRIVGLMPMLSVLRAQLLAANVVPISASQGIHGANFNNIGR
jgi:hypothetical protein